jgi:hypothetical protein
MCELNYKLVACNISNPPSAVRFDNSPETYNATFQIGYDINYLADQDGTVDEQCTRAFINKISTKEQFGYLSCMETEINFDNFLSDLIDTISASFLGDTIIQSIADITQST